MGWDLNTFIQRFSGRGFGVYRPHWGSGFGFKAWGNPGSELKVQGIGFRAFVFWIWGLNPKSWGLGCWFPEWFGLGIKPQTLRFDSFTLIPKS